MQNDFFYPIETQYLTDCMLNVTDNCNLTCKYCFVKQQPHYMTLNTAKATVDWLYKNFQKKIRMGIIDKNEKIRLYFFGGEPMLCYKSIIVPIIEYCKNVYSLDLFQFGMTTNGTLLNKRIIDFMKQYNFQLLLSMDGTPETQNFNRPCKKINQDSFKLIKKNIPYLLKNFPDLQCRMTIYAPSVQNLFQDYIMIEKLGFKNWDAIIDSRHNWTKEQIFILKEQMSQIYAYRLQQIINKKTPLGNSHIDDWLSTTAQYYKNKSNFNIQNHCSVFRCGLATTTGAVGWDGSIYGCQEQVSNGKESIFYIGNVLYGGIDIKLHYKLLSSYYNNQIIEKMKKNECKNCELQQICKINYQRCISTINDLFNDMTSMPEIECQMMKIHFYNSLLTLRILFSLNDKDILTYILKIVNQEGG